MNDTLLRLDEGLLIRGRKFFSPFVVAVRPLFATNRCSCPRAPVPEALSPPQPPPLLLLLPFLSTAGPEEESLVGERERGGEKVS